MLIWGPLQRDTPKLRHLLGEKLTWIGMEYLAKQPPKTRSEWVIHPGGREKLGEILVYSPANTRGYYKNPTADKELFTPDNYIRTGRISFVISCIACLRISAFICQQRHSCLCHCYAHLMGVVRMVSLQHFHRFPLAEYWL